MAYGKGYSIKFKNLEEQVIRIKIIDTASDPFANETTFTELQGAGDVLHITTVDNDEYKFSPIRALQAHIKFIAEPTFSFYQLIDGSDFRWKVEIVIGEPTVVHTLFLGFLVMDDLYQPYLNPDNNLVIDVIATDGIGLLKDVELTTFENQPFVGLLSGPYRVSKYFAFALRKTGLTLNMYVVNNIREENTKDTPFISSMHIHSKTFEKEVGESLDCYTVLQMLLGESCMLTQYNGAWWVVRIDEIIENNYTRSLYGITGDLDTGQTVVSDAGQQFRYVAPAPLKLLTQTTLRAQRPAKKIIENYRYEYAREIIDNIDFRRGDRFPFPAQIYPGNVLHYIDDWVKSNRFTFGPAEANVFIQSVIEDGYEKERFVTITKSPGNNGTSIFSKPIPLHAKDKFSFSVDRRQTENGPGGISDYIVAQVRLYGDDGTFWTVRSETGQWFACTSTFQTFQNYVKFRIDPAERDMRDWQSASVEANPLPVSGDIVIWLIQTEANNFTADTHFQNLQFTYKPFINGSYQLYRGQEQRVTQGLNPEFYRKDFDNQVYISDSPKKILKGAFLNPWGLKPIYAGEISFGTNGFTVPGNHLSKFTVGLTLYAKDTDANNGQALTITLAQVIGPNTTVNIAQSITSEADTFATLNERISDKYTLADRFYDIRTPFEKKPFGEIQAFDVWNQTNRNFRLFDFSSKGLTTFPGAIHAYRIVQPLELNKVFMLLNMDQDWRRCEMTGVLAEVYDSTLGKATKLTDKHEFKYVTER